MTKLASNIFVTILVAQLGFSLHAGLAEPSDMPIEEFVLPPSTKVVVILNDSIDMRRLGLQQSVEGHLKDDVAISKETLLPAKSRIIGKVIHDGATTRRTSPTSLSHLSEK